MRSDLASLSRRAAGGDLAAAERLVREIRSGAAALEGPRPLARAREAARMLLEAVREGASAAAFELDERMRAGQDHSEAESWALCNSPIMDEPDVVCAAAMVAGYEATTSGNPESAFLALVEEERSRKHGGPFKAGDAVWARAVDRWSGRPGRPGPWQACWVTSVGQVVFLRGEMSGNEPMGELRKRTDGDPRPPRGEEPSR